MQPALKIFILLAILFGTTSASSASMEQNQSAALAQNLHNHQDWHRLLQYWPRTLRTPKSEIRSIENSFLADDGRTNPKAELQATIKALYQIPPIGQEDIHPRCRFIARYEFLKNHLSIPKTINSITCRKFENWNDIDKIDSVSLVFASGYFRNPASFFGHPILKFNQVEGYGASLLDTTLNNGAVVPAGENPVVYMIKGIFGGYESAFSDTRFYQINHSYAESDLRDLWHYKLTLSRDEVERLVYYSWELLEHRFDYKFFSKNCGYFLENLLLYAFGERISSRNAVYTVPSKTFFNLIDSPRLHSISREPSRQSRFREKHAALSKSEQDAVKEYISKDHKVPNFNSVKSELKFIDTLTDYHQFMVVREKTEKNKNGHRLARRALFAKRLKLQTNSNEVWPDKSTSTAPHTASLPSLARISIINNSEFGVGINLRLRPVSYDITDLDGGRVPDSKLNMFNTELVLLNDSVRLSRFDLVDISTTNISPTGLPGDGGLGWGLRFGAELADQSCLNCLLAYAGGSAIKGKTIGQGWTAYLQAEGVLHSKYLESQVRLESSIGVIGHILPNWKTHMKIGQRVHLNGSQRNENTLIWSNRFGNNNKKNLTLDLKYNRALELSLGYGLYW